MNKIEVISRRILGWKLNRWDRWYDPEKGNYEVCFNEVCEAGKTLPEAITNAAFSLADNSTIADEWL